MAFHTMKLSVNDVFVAKIQVGLVRVIAKVTEWVSLLVLPGYQGEKPEQPFLDVPFVSDPPQVGFESRVMGDYPARFEEHFYPALVNGRPSIKQEGSIFSHRGVTIDSIYYYDYNSFDEQLITFDSYMIPEDDLELGQSHLLEVDNRMVLLAKSHIHFIVTSADVPHSWDVLSLGVKYDFVPGYLNQTTILDRLGRRDFAKGGLSVREEGIFPLSFQFLTRFALQKREGIHASIKSLRSSYGHKEIRNCTISRVDRGPDLYVEKSSQPEAEKKAYDSVGVKYIIPTLDVPKDDEPNPAGRTLLTGLELEWDRPKSSLPIR
ncbi:cytochrome c oxidase subunit 2 [Capsicum chinense]|nr:cytochrome c oxidase subunit 2 [Capsicum chinense]